MSEAKQELLHQQVAYSGEGISVRSLEETISTVRSKQGAQVEELARLKERNVQLQQALTEEVGRLRKLSDYVSQGRLQGGFLANLKEILSKIPGLRNLSLTRRSISELLRQQYEISLRRVKEAADFADRLKAAEADLHQEIKRLNQRIVEAAKNEETAAEYVLKVQELRAGLEAEAALLDPGAARTRELQTELDEARRVLSDHAARLHLYHTAEERLALLKDSTRKLTETVGNLYTDITRYVQAASEKLDLVAGQIQALGTAADASVVMLELKRSLDVMGESMNQTTRFVSETQLYFRTHIDQLVDELALYDGETRKVLDANLAQSRELEEQRIARAIAVAQTRQAQGGSPTAP